ncbi:MAG: MTH1187 family thiamine-binding protein [Candidatus Thiodiazotropha sp.]
MKALVNLQLIPVGTEVSVSKYVAACERVLEESGLIYQLHANGTNIEGEWDEVFTAVRRCHEVVHGMGAPRIHSMVSVGTRIDREQTLDDKVASVRRQLEK